MSTLKRAGRGGSAVAPQGRQRAGSITANPNVIRRWLAAAGLVGMVAGTLPASPAAAALPVPVGGTISTVAGSGNCDPLAPLVAPDCSQYSGDGGPATSALLHQPNSPVFDSAGNMYFADRENHAVRKVAHGGDGVVTGGAGETISTLAGGTLDVDGYPSSGFSGDGGQATLSALDLPTALAITTDSNGLLIADQGNHRVRYVDLRTSGAAVTKYGKTGIDPGEIHTVAGNGTAGLTLNNPSGVAIGANDDLYIADMFNQVVRKLTAAGTASTVAGTGTGGFSGDGGPATSSTLWGPIGVTVSGSKLFISDKSNHNVRLVNLNASGGASVTANGVTVAAGNINTVAGCSSGCGGSSRGFFGDGAPARLAQLNFPFSTAVDGAGNLYVSDEANHRVRVVDSAGTIYTYAGIDACTAAPVPSPPQHPTCTGGYVVDGVPAAAARLGNPRGVAVNGTSLYIADSRNQRVRRVNPITL